jgi:hypothetical protein
VRGWARVSSRTRITVALIGLIALVVIGWFTRDFLGHPPDEHRGAAVSVESAEVVAV